MPHRRKIAYSPLHLMGGVTREEWVDHHDMEWADNKPCRNCGRGKQQYMVMGDGRMEARYFVCSDGCGMLRRIGFVDGVSGRQKEYDVEATCPRWEIIQDQDVVLPDGFDAVNWIGPRRNQRRHSYEDPLSPRARSEPSGRVEDDGGEPDGGYKEEPDPMKTGGVWTQFGSHPDLYRLGSAHPDQQHRVKGADDSQDPMATGGVWDGRYGSHPDRYRLGADPDQHQASSTDDALDLMIKGGVWDGKFGSHPNQNRLGVLPPTCTDEPLGYRWPSAWSMLGDTTPETQRRCTLVDSIYSSLLGLSPHVSREQCQVADKPPVLTNSNPFAGRGAPKGWKLVIDCFGKFISLCAEKTDMVDRDGIEPSLDACWVASDNEEGWESR